VKTKYTNRRTPRQPDANAHADRIAGGDYFVEFVLCLNFGFWFVLLAWTFL